MNKVRFYQYFVGFSLLLALIINIALAQPTVASFEDENTPAQNIPSLDVQPAEESIELKSPYPVLKEKAGNLFEFQVELHYHGSKARVFDLSVIGNQGSYIDILASFTATDKGIESILVKPDQEFPEVIKVRYNPVLAKRTEPGPYVITLRASSGNLSATIDLTAVVTARYELIVNTVTGRLNAEITAGKENHLSMIVMNTSSVDLKDVRLTANVPQNWGIKFIPDVINNIGVGENQYADMIITPDRDTIAGDYEIKAMAIHSDALKEISLRITVATPTIWGWISVIIIILVVFGLVAIFIRLGRR